MKIIKIFLLIMIILIFYISYNNTEGFTILDFSSQYFDTYDDAHNEVSWPETVTDTYTDPSKRYVLAKIIDSNLDFVSDDDNNYLKNKELILTLSFIANGGNEEIIVPSGTSPDASRLEEINDNIFCKKYNDTEEQWYICGAHITNSRLILIDSNKSQLQEHMNTFFSNASSFIPSDVCIYPLILKLPLCTEL